MKEQTRHLIELAKAQHGVVAYRQLRALGVSRSSHQHSVSGGEWLRELPAVYRSCWAEVTWMQRAWTAWLWAGPTATLTHSTAAALCGFDLVEETVEVTAANNLDPPVDWVRFHRRCPQRQRPTKTVMIAGLRVTSPEDTLIDIASRLSDVELARLLRQAIRHRAVSLSEMRRAVSDVSSRVSGVGRIRRLLE